MPRLQVRVSLFLSLATKLTKHFCAPALLPCLLMVSVPSLAQNTGLSPFNQFSNTGGGIDTINLGNLNVHMEIPLRSLGAYGPTASASLVMDSMVTVAGISPHFFLSPLALS